MRDSHTLPRSTWLLLAALSLFWGMNWPMIKMALGDLPVWTFRALCTLVGGSGLLLIARLSRQSIALPRAEWLRMGFTSLFNITLWNVLVTYGVRELPSGRSAILAYTMPLWTILLSAWLLGEKLTPRRILGVSLGMAGLLLLLGRELLSLQSAPLGAALIIGGAMSWSFGITLIKKYPSSLKTAAFTGWNLIIGGLPLLAGALLFDPPHWRPVGLPSMIGLLYNIFIAFIFCHWAWFRLVELAPVGISSLGSLMIPVVAVISGMVILGEQPHWQDYVALGLILAAVGSVIVPARGTPPPSTRAPDRR
ncbi:MAG: DMT family transporter [Burkholderiales bacterium]|nr:DMT family transporter [Burkholderiales bacterium]